MIAPQTLPPQQQPRHAERARTASNRRVRRAQRRNVVGFVKVLAIMGLAALPVLVYVMLTANVTSMTYRIARAQTERSQLLEASQRYDDTLAHLRSPERLAAVAAKLKMHDPSVFAVVDLPSLTVKPAPHGIAFLGDWFK
jgi:cell division protein FtsL